MPMPPHPTFDFSKVVTTQVTHSLVDTKQVVGVAWVQGQIAHAEAHASAYAPNSMSQNSHGSKNGPLAHRGLLGVYFGDQRCLCQLDSLAKGVSHR